MSIIDDMLRIAVLGQAPIVPPRASDGWIEWNGGSCPVAPDVPVQVKFRCGDLGSNDAGDWSWGHSSRGFDYEIIAYRLLSEPDAPQPDELERFVRHVWTLLNGVVEANDDAVWADDTTTVHEAFIEVVNEYRPELAEEFFRELEQ